MQEERRAGDAPISHAPNVSFVSPYLLPSHNPSFPLQVRNAPPPRACVPGSLPPPASLCMLQSPALSRDLKRNDDTEAGRTRAGRGSARHWAGQGGSLRSLQRPTSAPCRGVARGVHRVALSRRGRCAGGPVSSGSGHPSCRSPAGSKLSARPAGP